MNHQPNSHLGQPLDIDWVGKGTDYIKLSFKVILLKLPTFFIYHFWGKTEVRKNLWSHVHINNEPLEYTGTGMQLFLGFLFTVFLVFIPITFYIIALQFLTLPQNLYLFFAGLALLYVVILFLVGVAVYSAQRYRLSRTQWRGIRGSLKGSAWSYGWTTFWTTLFVILTAGLATPWQSIKLQRVMTEHTHFGEMPMRFTGSSKSLYKHFIIPLLIFLGGLAILYTLIEPILTIFQTHHESGIPLDPLKAIKLNLKLLGYSIGFNLIMMVVFASYQSKYYNHIAENTHFSNGNFALNTTPGGLIWLNLSNFFIVASSLGILVPVATARLFGYIVNNLSFQGNVDLAGIEQSQQPLSKTGEGLAEGLDVNTF